jgi:protocatechuate 3,4-dioxygenase beta subunit
LKKHLIDVEDRRRFVKSASVFALTFAALPPALACQQDGVARASLDAARPSRIDIADRKEPGARLLLSGTIYGADGKPAPGVKMFLYHTDAEGYYSRPASDPRRSRLRGTVWSDSHGRYAFDTVKPGHYAGVSQPPPLHIHVHLEPPRLADHWVESFYFEGDEHLHPSVVARARGLERLSHVITLKPGEPGVLQGVRDFRIDPALAERNRIAADWYRGE